MGGPEPYDRGMPTQVRLLAMSAWSIAVVVGANLIFAQAPDAAGLIGLGGLGLVLATLTAGLRAGVIASILMGVLGGIAIAGGDNTLIQVLVMVLAAAGLGLTARWKWNRGFILLPITLAFVAAESPAQEPLQTGIAFAAAMTGYALIASLGTALLRGKQHDSQQQGETSSWSRTIGYATVLATAAIATTTIAVTLDWGHTGGWLIMTPFIVISPYVQDGWHKAINRAIGTVGGFAIASALAFIFGSGPALSATGVAFAALAAVALVKQWHYAIYALFLTPAIVILESIGRPIEQTADNRLLATVLGVGIALAVMAVAVPTYRRTAKEAGIDHY